MDFQVTEGIVMVMMGLLVNLEMGKLEKLVVLVVPGHLLAEIQTTLEMVDLVEQQLLDQIIQLVEFSMPQQLRDLTYRNK